MHLPRTLRSQKLIQVDFCEKYTGRLRENPENSSVLKAAIHFARKTDRKASEFVYTSTSLM